MKPQSREAPRQKRPQARSEKEVRRCRASHDESGYRESLQAVLRCLKLVNDASGSFRADLVRIEETAGNSINRQSKRHVPMMGVQVHADAT